MSCAYFVKVWKNSDPGRRRLLENHSPESSIRVVPKPPQYVRWDKFIDAEPPRFPVRECRCGCSDAWRCWVRVFADELMGQHRATDDE